MEGSAKLIAEEIESKRYFLEARKWYADIFLQPTRDAALMIIASTALIFIVTFTMYNVSNVFPLSKKVDVVLSLRDTIKYYATLKNISEGDKSTKQVVTEYLCANYVKARESYNTNRFPANYYFVLHSSSKEIFDVYHKYITESNDSPIMLHKNGYTVEIETISSSLNTQNDSSNIELDGSKKYDSVNVKFTKKVYDASKALISSSNLEANVMFYLSDYDFSKSVSSKLDFIVTHYDVKEIKN